MGFLEHSRSRAALVLAAASATIGLAASASPAAGASQTPDTAALAIESAGLEALMPDRRDAILRSLIRLLPDRLLEISTEIPDAQALPEPLVRMFADAISSPMTMRVDIADDPAAGGPPMSAQMTIHPRERATAQGMSDMLVGAATAQGMQFRRSDDPGIRTTDSPMGPMVVGVRDFDGRGAFVIGVNAAAEARTEITGHGLPAGVTPAIAAHFDTRRLTPLIEMMAAQSGEPEGAAQMQMAGIGGPDGMKATIAYGFDDERAHTSIVMHDHAALAERLGLDPSATIPMSELRAIPRDPIAVQTSVGAISQLVRTIDNAMSTVPEIADGAGQVDAVLGFSLRDDLIAHLGDTITVYRSDATGGGGLMSTVALVGLSDPDALARTHQSLVDRINREVTPLARGYVSIRSSMVGEQELFTLSFNGIPVPLELTWGIQGDHLVLGASTNAVVTAMAQARSGRDSFADRRDVAAMAGGSLEGLTALRYMDTPRAAAAGYGGASLLAAAIGNALRSPRSTVARDPGPSMPSYAEFVDGIVPMVMVTRWDGDDLVTRAQSHRSMMVNLAGAFESSGGATTVAAVALGAGLLTPALSRARENATMVKSGVQARQMVMAMQVWAVDHDGAFPESFGDLVQGDYATWELFGSPFGPYPDGGPDYGYRRPTMDDDADPSRVIVVVDRAMLWMHSETNVAFADGHVEKVDVFGLVELLDAPENAGVEDAMGLADLVSWARSPGG